MKKFFLLVVAAMMTVVTVQAQSGYEDTKHEVAVSLGGASNSQWIDVFEDAFVSMVGYRFEDGSAFGPLSVEYFYHLNPVVGVGAIGAFAHETKDILFSNEKYGEAKNTFITVLPAVKFNWLRKKNFGMYSKLAAGLTFASKKEDYSKGSVDNRSETKVGFNFQVSALGIEAGSENIRGFVELGVGEQGVALAGIRVKF